MYNNDDKSIPEFITAINNVVDEPKVLEDPGFDKLRIDMYFYQVNNLDKMNERDRFNFIKSNIDFIANQVLDGTCRYTRKLADPVFLNTVKEVLKSMPITQLRKIFINKLAFSYQYYTGANEATQMLLVDVTREVNRPYIQMLQSIGLTEDHSAYLVMCRFSSTDEMVNVNRLNYMIYCIGREIMTEQQIVWVYEKLFDQMRYLFAASMLETKETMVPPKGHREEDFYETFSTASLALLTIVNNMTSADIDLLVRIFLDHWTSAGRPMTRFSLRALSGDFGRLRTVVETLSEKQRLYIP